MTGISVSKFIFLSELPTYMLTPMTHKIGFKKLGDLPLNCEGGVSSGVVVATVPLNCEGGMSRGSGWGHSVLEL